MNWLFSAVIGLVWRCFMCATIVALAGCSAPAPVRNVAYDPYVPSALLTHRPGAMVSVAYGGTLVGVRHLTRTEEAHKEVIILDE